MSDRNRKEYENRQREWEDRQRQQRQNQKIAESMARRLREDSEKE